MRAGVGALAAALLALSTGVHAAPRVVSLDQCADQYVLALSPREDIAGLSTRARADDSYLREKARGLPIVRADTEAILGASPEVVIRLWGGSQELLADLARRRVRIVRLDDARDFEGVRANIRRVAQALREEEGGERLIGEMDAKLASAAGPGAAGRRSISPAAARRADEGR